MKVLVYPHLMEIGGSQLNAIELAESIADAGHEVVLFAPSGALVEVARAKGLEVIESPSENRWPRASTLLKLLWLVRSRSFDLVHAYEWGPSAEVALGPYTLLGTPMVTTVMSMEVPHLVPLQPPLVVGTRELADLHRPRRDVHLAEPWIDTHAQRPGAIGTAEARAAFGFSSTDFVVSVVCRLTTDLGKAEGVLAAVRAVHDLNTEGQGRRVRLLVVGDGAQMTAVRRAADDAASSSGRRDVVITGPLLDPRPGYECADVVIGMGSSALKGLAFAKPLIVQGEHSWWMRFTPGTADVFKHQGFFGVGDPSSSSIGKSSAHLQAELSWVLTQDEATLARLGDLGRRFVQETCSLTSATSSHLSLYKATVARTPALSTRVSTFARTAMEVAKLRASLARARRSNPAQATSNDISAAKPEMVSAVS